jgi:hypothetical protein
LVLWLLPPWARWNSKHTPYVDDEKPWSLFVRRFHPRQFWGLHSDPPCARCAATRSNPLSVEEIRAATHVMKTDERLASAVFR